MNQPPNTLKELYRKWAKEEATGIKPIAESGSYRKYYRIKGKEKIALGVYNLDRKENRAFISLTRHFLKKGLNVPRLYSSDLKNNIYLLEDLGDETLFSFAQKKRRSDLKNYYKRSLEYLISFQTDGGKGFDYSVCYPRRKYDRQSILWDLNYFKYYFLKLAKIQFDEQNLEGDFNKFAHLLLRAESKYFLYRDFQARNILLNRNELFFIDYQGGRKGALQYDVASLLYQAQINFSPDEREELLDYYLTEVNKKVKIKSKDFLRDYYNFVLIRLLQTFGAYGFRGFFENKAYFLKSIPFAINNLDWLISNRFTNRKFVELKKVLIAIVHNKELKKFTAGTNKKLKVTINSFSYKNGLPIDYTGNGGGFVFDCRSLNNPGRYPEYFSLTGKDDEIVNFLEKKSNVTEFLNSAYAIIDDAVVNYRKRSFQNLMVNFGCTGGQHRSVYCAEKLALHLRNKFDVIIELNHIQLNKKATQ